MAWFGPKGVATMTFSLLILARHVQSGQRIFNLAALAVFASILAARPDRHAGDQLDRPAQPSRVRRQAPIEL